MKKGISLSVFIAIFSLMISGCTTKQEQEPVTGYSPVSGKEQIEIDPGNDDVFSGDLTVDMYVKINGYPEYWLPLIAKHSSDVKNEFCLRMKNKKAGQWYYGNGKKTFVLPWEPEKALPLNEWVRLTAIRDYGNNAMELFVNGKPVAKKHFKTMPEAAKTNAKIILLGNGKMGMDAAVAQVRIWNKVLTASEMEKTEGNIPDPGNETSLIGYWKFDKVEDGKIKDLSRSKRDAQIRLTP